MGRGVERDSAGDGLTVPPTSDGDKVAHRSALCPYLERGMDSEVWKVVPEWCAYEVSSSGRVRRIETGRILSQNTDKDGYKRLNLSCGGRRRNWRVHALVLLAFEGAPPPGKSEVAHWDGDVSNNSLVNLRYATCSENCADKRRHGRMPIGERAHNARLSDSDAARIFDSRKRGAAIGELAADYGLSKASIKAVLYARGRFRWLAEPLTAPAK
jgi:hypothetical protein